MKRKAIEDAIETLQADVASVADSKTKTILSGLFNLVEALYSENESLREENQQLKDQINRLKGEQGKPNIKGRHKKDTPDHSSCKATQGSIDRQQVCPIDKDILPNSKVIQISSFRTSRLPPTM